MKGSVGIKTSQNSTSAGNSEKFDNRFPENAKKGERRDYCLSHQNDEKERSKGIRHMASEETQNFICEFLLYSTMVIQGTATPLEP